MEITKVVGNRVLLKPIEKKTKSGLIVSAGTLDELPNYAIVELVGEGINLDIGSKVIYNRGRIVKLEDGLLLVDYHDILCIVSNG